MNGLNCIFQLKPTSSAGASSKNNHYCGSATQNNLCLSRFKIYISKFIVFHSSTLCINSVKVLIKFLILIYFAKNKNNQINRENKLNIYLNKMLTVKCIFAC